MGLGGATGGDIAKRHGIVRRQRVPTALAVRHFERYHWRARDGGRELKGQDTTVRPDGDSGGVGAYFQVDCTGIEEETKRSLSASRVR
ncbi:hypothetical protein HYQ46_001444 [Verticillium longisporum]|nr:hypothetical protein HYQ46_001444 [Verticillium longisporum]